MSINLSVKDAPDDLVRRLKERAARNHRSLRGEVVAILEEAVARPRRLSPLDVLAEVRRMGLSTPGESAALIRDDRDGRQGR